nr:CRISPR system precrRNA processing endoribonuclease RAMP protein Cas6 [Chloroflexota bacterium]
MHHFAAHRLRFVAEVQTPIELNEHQGSAIRGALFKVLRRNFCLQQHLDSCQPCPLHASCPVSFLLATVENEGWRGADLPRPYTIEPPLGATPSYAPGERLEFGLTMFSRALNLFPYVVVGVNALQREGIGRKVKANGWRRGTFLLREIWAENPLTGYRQPVMRADDPLVNVPDIPITHEQIMDSCAALEGNGPGGEVTLFFLTPTRLIEQGRLLHTPLFRPLLQRLFERLSALARAYSDTPLELDFRALLQEAEQIRLAADHTYWVEWDSYSTRRQTRTPMSGFMGRVTYAGPIEPFLPWLLWGQFTHVGKDAVKGNGWYQLLEKAL